MQRISVSVIVFLAVLIAKCNSSANVHVEKSFMVDDAGRVRIFHGANFVVKEFPWYPKELLDSNYVAHLSGWGLNFVRLGMMWSGVEPQPQRYNTTYLDIMKTIVQLLEKNNIFVLFDMHQDVLSNQTGTYDGIPRWLYDRFPPPAHKYPWPLQTPPPEENWFFGYITEACSHGFQCLYNNTAGAIESMGNFWRLVASTYKQYSNVLGYELINEPWAGDYIDNPLLILPGVAGATNLQPFYEKLSKAIRSVDNDTLIFYEPVTWGVRLNGKYVGTGFTHVPGGDDYRDRSVLSYHYYCIILSLDPVPGNSTIPVFDRVLCDEVEGPALFRSVQIDIAQLGGSAFLTEFGGCDDTQTCDEQLEWGLNGADSYFQSWAYWGDFYNVPRAINRLSRVYAPAIAGKPVSMAFSSSDREFFLYYNIDTSIKQPTEIFVSPIQYPKSSYNITVSDGLKWHVDSTNPNIILVEPTNEMVKSARKDAVVFVTIRPKN